MPATIFASNIDFKMFLLLGRIGIEAALYRNSNLITSYSKEVIKPREKFSLYPDVYPIAS